MEALGVSPRSGRVDGDARLERLVHEAAVLDARARWLMLEDERLAELRRRLDRETESIDAQATDVQEREKQLERRQAELSAQRERREAWLKSESERIASAEERLAAREQRFEWRWRWLISLLNSLRFRRRSTLQPCDVLFVPTQGGYRMLAQSGIAVGRGTKLRGLLDERRRFEVTKIAVLPFEERICAYLQEISSDEGGST